MEKKKVTTHRRETPIKKRSLEAYQRKISKVTKWYNNLLKERENPTVINSNTKQEPKRKQLKPLDFYIDKIKKVVN
jgi:hypothetical protein